MNRKHAKNEIMDSGLGSDEDRRGTRTKEQKQLRNQQLVSGCFIDAASLSDEAEVEVQRRNDERRQGALIFQSSIPQFSMLQISNGDQQEEEDHPQFTTSATSASYSETATPFNSIVQLENGGTMDEDTARNRSPLGFYVDLSEVPDMASAQQPVASAKKNIFSMVIDFEAPKKDKPTTLTSSLILQQRRSMRLSKNKCNGSLSSSLSSINSNVAGTSRQSEERESLSPPTVTKQTPLPRNIEVLSASLVKNLSKSSSASTSNDDSGSEKNNLVVEKSEEELVDEDKHEDSEDNTGSQNNGGSPGGCRDEAKIEDEVVEKESVEKTQTCPQFVRLSDLEQPATSRTVDLGAFPSGASRMSRSIPESRWADGPLVMSRSTGGCYRTPPRPIEPEGGASDTEEENNGANEDSDGEERPRKAVRRLGTDLLRMFLEEISPDVVVEVDGHKFKAHKCILASRCQYFAAILSGNWLEKSGNVISMQGFSYESVYFSLCHIYSGAAHVPESINLAELASLSDLLGLEGLKEVVERALSRRHCHHFHRPCAGCCTGVLEVLPLAAAYGLDDLYRRCLHWITQHFVKVWPSRAFATLPRELREKCYQQHVVHMCPDKVLETVMACDKVLATLPSMRWAEPVKQLILQLQDACYLYHRQHYSQVLGSRYFLSLDTGLGLAACQIEEQMLSAAKNLGVEQACRSYTRCCKMLDQIWSRPFADLLNKIKVQLEQCLVGQSDRLIRSNAWLRLDTALRTRIKELTPSSEPQSRLPRATHLKPKKTQSPIISSSDSSRNSSPAMSQQGKLHTGGSPSLRRSLLLAAKAPQVPPSPSANRRSSTLTQPTAASAARSAANSRNIKPTPSAVRSITNPSQKPTFVRPALQPTQRPIASRPVSLTANQRPTVVTKSRPSTAPLGRAAAAAALPAKKETTPTSVRRGAQFNRAASPLRRAESPLKRAESPLSRAASPLHRAASPLNRAASPMHRASSPMNRVGSSRRVDSKVTSPMTNVMSQSATKEVGSPRKQKVKAEGHSRDPVPPPCMTRSGTFLKDEPTIIGKVI